MNKTVLLFSLWSVLQGMAAAGMMAHGELMSGVVFFIAAGLFAVVAECCWTEPTAKAELEYRVKPIVSDPSIAVGERITDEVKKAQRDGRLR